MWLIFKKSSLLREGKRLWASLVAQLVKNLPVVLEMMVHFLCQDDLLQKGWATHSSVLGLSWWLDVTESTYNVGDLGSIPVLERSPGEGKGYPLQYFDLENSMDCSLPGSSVHGDSPDKKTRVGCHALLQGIFPTQELNPGLPHCRQILYHLSHQGSSQLYRGR